MEKGWGIDLIHGFFATIDRAIYGLISTIYQIILDIANAQILSSAAIEEIYTRLYALLGIFMLFKVTFSFVNYIINPDSFTDQAKGVQNLVRNVLIVLVLIILTPFAFDKLYEAQAAIIGDNIIPNLVFGTNDLDKGFKMSPECDRTATAASDGDYLAMVTFRPFYQLDPDQVYMLHANGDLFYSRYCSSFSAQTTSRYLVSTIYNAAPSTDYYYVDYKYFLSTIVGLFVVLLLISFAFDIAVRTIKLAFLQVIAPIPIMSFIDPATSKNGSLSKWLKQVGATWASLFIRLFALFFAVLIISKFDSEVIKATTSGEHMFWVMLFILIAALMFAKQMPKVVEDLIPGLKMPDMQLNPFKRISSEAMGGKVALGLGGAAIGMGAASISNLGYRIKEGLDQRKDQKALLENDDYQTARQSQLEYNRFKKQLDAHRAKPGKTMSDQSYNGILDKKRATLSDPDFEANLEKMQEGIVKRGSKFSYKHPILSNISQTWSGAKIGYAQGQSGKMPSIINIGKTSSGVRDYKDVYSIKDRVENQATDFFGVKNDSGTTELNAKYIKEANDRLTNLNRSIEMMNKSFSDLATRMGAMEFNQATTLNTKTGRYDLNPSYNGAFKNELSSMINEIASLEKERLSTVKEINRLEKIRDKRPPKPGGGK